MTPRDRPRAIHFVLLHAIAIVLFASLLHGRLNEWGGDNLVFLLPAKALATGQGYVDLQLGRPIPHIHYPPLFPALLVPLVASNASIDTITVVVAGLGLLGLNAQFVLFSRTLGARFAWLVTAGVRPWVTGGPRLLDYTEDRVLGIIEVLPGRFLALETGRLSSDYRILPPPAPQRSQDRP